MPDIREILSALSPDDQALWSQHRTEMRRSYLHAHNMTIGIDSWEAVDDMFMDLIDIRLAQLFDRAGKLEATKDILGNDDKKISEIIERLPMNGKSPSKTDLIDKATGWN